MMALKLQFCLLATLFVLVTSQRNPPPPQNPNQIPKELIDYMATREMRYHHFLWHNIRNVWYDFDRRTRDQITKLGWAPPRPAYTPSRATDSNNNSGEDFLYMHRQLIEDANRILSKYSLKVTGFKTIPKPGDKEYPVPRGGNNENYQKWKSDDFYLTKIKPVEDRLTNPDYLKTITLGQLGSIIEFGIHNSLHVRFANVPSETRPSTSDGMPYIDKKWDDPKYNSLLDTYSSHVNPVFWKIHGWVDDRIEDWKKANNVSSINWKGTWLGGPKSNIKDLMDTTNNNGRRKLKQMKHKNMDNKHDKHSFCLMEKAVRLLLKSDKCFYYNCFA